MDDYTNENLVESRNEWVSRLINILLPHLVEGVNSIFKESYVMCNTNNERDKYLMTFQNFLSRIPSWNQTIIDQECQRIITNSKCNYINDLLTCVHVIMLKTLTNVRVCKNQKKIDIDIPKLEGFIHNVYIQIARKIYKNIYLYEQDCSPLQKQKNNRECECIIRDCILSTIRDTIPVDTILRAYMSENMEEDVEIEDTYVEPMDVSHNIIPTASERRPETANDIPDIPEKMVDTPVINLRDTETIEETEITPAVNVNKLDKAVVSENTENLLENMSTLIKQDSSESVEIDFDTLPSSNMGDSIRISDSHDDGELLLNDITEL